MECVDVAMWLEFDMEVDHASINLCDACCHSFEYQYRMRFANLWRGTRCPCRAIDLCRGRFASDEKRLATILVYWSTGSPKAHPNSWRNHLVQFDRHGWRLTGWRRTNGFVIAQSFLNLVAQFRIMGRIPSWPVYRPRRGFFLGHLSSRVK